MYISESTSLVWSNALVYLNISIKITSKESFYVFKLNHPCGLIFQRLSRSVEAGVPAGLDCAWKTWAIMRSLITAVTLQSNMPPVDNQKSQLFQPAVCFFIFCPVCLIFFRFVLRTKHIPDMYWASHYPFLLIILHYRRAWNPLVLHINSRVVTCWSFIDIITSLLY